MSSASACSHSSDLLNYALSTNNPELIALLSQARDLIQFDYHKAIEITDFFANQYNVGSDNCEKSFYLFVFIHSSIIIYHTSCICPVYTS